MTLLDPVPSSLRSAESSTRPVRKARHRRYAMCEPLHFRVDYAINPWMVPGGQVDSDRAVRQWRDLVATYRGLGHEVDLIEPDPALPDMVFAANGALCVGGRAYGAAFRHAERRPEADAWADWLALHGLPVQRPAHTNEGEGDFLVLGHTVLAGTGFRTSIDAHVEAAQALDRPVVTLELVDPLFYHLDVALAVLDDGNGEASADIAYYPPAFSAHSLRTLRDLFPDALEVDASDALSLGLNAVSDGLHVVVPSAAKRLITALELRGYIPVPVDVDELLTSGGSVKCCTMELHA